MKVRPGLPDGVQVRSLDDVQFPDDGADYTVRVGRDQTDSRWWRLAAWVVVFAFVLLCLAYLLKMDQPGTGRGS